MQYNDYETQELPMGFSMALANDPAALEHFADMTPEEQERVLSRTREVTSRGEMRAILRELREPLL